MDGSAGPLVSVVVPTYNQPALLAETLDSVVAQTFTDYEVIVVDDGSTDDTPARLRLLAGRHPGRLRVVTQANAGTGAARNRGIDEARGRYVALLDHDDLWMPGKLAAQVAFLDDRPACVAAVVPYASSADPARPLFDPAAVADARGVIDRPMRRMGDKQPLMMTCSVLMFRRDAARDLRFATVRGAVEDVPFQARLLARGGLGVAGREVLAVYRTHAANTSREASYFYEGLKLLRRMDRDGAFAELSPADRADFDAWLGFIGRATAVVQLLQGRRARGAAAYLREFRHQLGQRRMAFLAAFPVFVLAPQGVVRAWYNKGRETA